MMIQNCKLLISKTNEARITIIISSEIDYIS